MSLYATCICGVPEGQEGAHRTDCAFYGVIPMSGPVCRGSWALGTACRRCERCLATKPLTCIDSSPSTSGEALSQLQAMGQDFDAKQNETLHRAHIASLDSLTMPTSGEEMRLREAAQRALSILERNLHRQTEKCDDAVRILRAALTEGADRHD